jgi:formylglycine-generating enzyme required for sulfatase activity
LNPTYYDENEPRKLIRGGSWKDIAFKIQTGTRGFEYQDSARSFIGFRTVMTGLGRSSGFEFD